MTCCTGTTCTCNQTNAATTTGTYRISTTDGTSTGGWVTFPSTYNGNLTIGAKTMQCEECGYQDQHWGTNLNNPLEITVPGFQGTYCRRCWAAFVASNIPRMREVK